jgi:hypothetical protein
MRNGKIKENDHKVDASFQNKKRQTINVRKCHTWITLLWGVVSRGRDEKIHVQRHRMRRLSNEKYNEINLK